MGVPHGLHELAFIAYHAFATKDAPNALPVLESCD